MRRGFVLLAIMIGLALATIVSLSLLQLAQAETAGAHYSAGKAQSQALARSGMQAIASRLREQRDEILAGRVPHLDEQYTIYENGNRLGVIRLLPVGQADALLESESAKLDINEVSVEQLVATGLVDDAMAQRIVQFRDQARSQPIDSLNELAMVPGMTNEKLFGSLERMQEQLATVRGETEDTMRSVGAARFGGRGGIGGPGAIADDNTDALADVFSVFSVEADVQQDGSPRFDLSQPAKKPEAPDANSIETSSEAHHGITGHIDDESSDPSADEFDAHTEDLPETVRWLRSHGTTFAKSSAIVATLRSFSIPMEKWSEYLDPCTTHAGALREGRLDINVAPLEALLAIPGITAEQAEAIVAAQDTLSDVERATVCWPVLLKILEPADFEKAVDHVTNRSWCYRMRLAAGEVVEDEPNGPLIAPVIFEVVFDLASSAPRVAYLRDITLLPTMITLAGRVEPSDTPFAGRVGEQALDDEIEAWDRKYGKHDTEDDAPERSRPSTPPRQTSASLSPPTPAQTTSSPKSHPSVSSGDPSDAPNSTSPSDEAPPVRRLGRWHGAN